MFIEKIDDIDAVNVDCWQYESQKNFAWKKNLRYQSR